MVDFASPPGLQDPDHKHPGAISSQALPSDLSSQSSLQIDGVVTCSTSATLASESSSPSGSPIVLTFAQSMALSKEGVCHKLQQAYQKNLNLLESNWKLQAQLDAANAHCTLSRWQLSETHQQLDNAKKSHSLTQQSVKTWARFITVSQLKVDFDKAEAEQKKKEK